MRRIWSPDTYIVNAKQGLFLIHLNTFLLDWLLKENINLFRAFLSVACKTKSCLARNSMSMILLDSRSVLCWRLLLLFLAYVWPWSNTSICIGIAIQLAMIQSIYSSQFSSHYNGKPGGLYFGERRCILQRKVCMPHTHSKMFDTIKTRVIFQSICDTAPHRTVPHHKHTRVL